MEIIILILIVYVMFTIGIGLYFRRKSQTVSDFLLGGRGIGPYITAFAYGASYFSTVVFIGYAGQFGWKYGIAAVWIGVGNALIGSLAAWAVLGRRTRVMTNYLKSATMPEFLGSRYNSKNIKIFAALISFIFLIPYTSSVYNGLSRLFSMVFPVSYETCIIIMAVITSIYVILGGYKATAYNDFFQGLIMIIGICLIIGAVLTENGGFYSSLKELSQIEVSEGALVGIKGGFTSFLGPDPINLVGVIILTSLGSWGLPQMVHKFYTIKDERSIKAGAIVSTAFAIIIAGGCYFLGSFGRLFVTPDANGLPISGYDEIVPAMISGFPDLLMGMTIIMVLSASMSTLSALVMTSSSSITLDLIKPAYDNKDKGKEMKEKSSILIMRLFIAIFLAISVIVAFNKNALIADLMGYSWGALAGSFLAPMLYGLFWKKVTNTAVYINFIFAVGTTVAHFIIKPQFIIAGFFAASPVNLGAFIMLASLIIVPAVSFITKKTDVKYTEDVFSCYNEKVTVKHSVALSGEEK